MSSAKDALQEFPKVWFNKDTEENETFTEPAAEWVACHAKTIKLALIYLQILQLFPKKIGLKK